MMQLRSPRTIAADLFSVSVVPHPGRAHRLPSVEIAGDFVFLDARSARAETEGRDAPLAKLGQDWHVFAASGTGDAWLVSDDDGQRIAFLDHNEGPDAAPQELGVDFSQWLQLADLIRQFESADDPALAGQAGRLIERISDGLFEKYPYYLET